MPRTLGPEAVRQLESMEPKRCTCGWLRPTTFDFSEDEHGLRPIRLPLQELYVLWDCPQCGARWNVHMRLVS